MNRVSVNKMSIEDRAKQFAPFASLRGYYDLVRQEELVKEDRKELSESEAEIISNTLNNIKKGMMVTIKYYKRDHHEELTGMVSEIDAANRKIKIIKTLIPFEDIMYIKIQ